MPGHQYYNDIGNKDKIKSCTLFYKLVMPVLLYGSEICGFHKTADIEKLHLLFCKKSLHLKWNTTNYFIYNVLGGYPLNVNVNYEFLDIGSRRLWASIIREWIVCMYQITYRSFENGISLNVEWLDIYN